MSARKWIVTAILPAFVLAWGLSAETVLGQYNSCTSGVCAPVCAPPHRHRDCPPPFRHWVEGPPNIRYKHACPRPVCPPCSLQYYGYYQPCWRPWPFPPDWSHCPYPVPASQVVPHEVLNFPQEGPGVQPGINSRPPNGQDELPPPARIFYTEPPLRN